MHWTIRPKLIQTSSNLVGVAWNRDYWLYLYEIKSTLFVTVEKHALFFDVLTSRTFDISRWKLFTIFNAVNSYGPGHRFACCCEEWSTNGDAYSTWAARACVLRSSLLPWVRLPPYNAPRPLIRRGSSASRGWSVCRLEVWLTIRTDEIGTANAIRSDTVSGQIIGTCA